MKGAKENERRKKNNNSSNYTLRERDPTLKKNNTNIFRTHFEIVCNINICVLFWSQVSTILAVRNAITDASGRSFMGNEYECART